MTPVHLALQRLETQCAFDGRCTCFDVDASIDGASVELTGIVDNASVRDRLSAELDRIPGVDGIANTVSTLDELATRATTAAPVAAVRRKPNEEVEQVTQALYGASLAAFDRRAGWQRVRTPDGYLGWMDESNIHPLENRESREPTARITKTVLDPEWHPDSEPAKEPPERLYAGTDCRIESADNGETTVSFRTGARGRIPASSVSRIDSASTFVSGTGLTEFAQQYLGTRYEWGGLTIEGIDCSGLIWLTYQCAGLTLPRDSDQQERLGVAVDRDELEPGDLLCFPGHIALSLGGDTYIHAYGEADGVGINSLDPEADEYLPALDESLRSIRRLLTAEEPVK